MKSGIPLLIVAIVFALVQADATAADVELNERSTPAALTHGPMIGHVTTNSALVWARVSRPGEYTLTVRPGSGQPATQTVRLKVSEDTDLCARWALDDLHPGTRYRYRIEHDSHALTGDELHAFSTRPPAAGLDVRLVFGSCAREDEGSAAVWRRMAALDPDAVILLGDTPYIDSTDLAVQRRRYREFAAVPEFQQLVQSRPLYSVWDDHDFGRNDTDGNLAGKEHARRAFTEYRANPGYGDGTEGIYTHFEWGGVAVFLLDTRYFAATEPSPGALDKPSLLGRTQWEWLLRELKASTAPFKVLACGMIWNGAVRPGKPDHWATYRHERDALFDWIGRENIPGVVLVGGDVHRTRALCHDTTGSAGYPLHEFITSPVHGSIIETANAPHPDLVFDTGTPNSFLLMTLRNRTSPPRLRMQFMNADGNVLYDTTITRSALE